MSFFSKAAGRCLSAVGAFALVSLFGISTAHAQATGGWTLNIDNTGYNPLPAGGLLPYTVKIGSNANTPIPATTVVFTIPATTVFLGVDGLQNCAPLPDPDGEKLAAPLQVTCDVPGLSPAKEITAKVNLRPLEAGNISLSGKIADPGPSFTRPTTIELGADLSVALQIAPATVQAGSTATFKATVTNQGPYPATGATLTIPLPTGLSPNVSLPSGCSYAAPNIKCEIAGPIAAGASLDFDFASQVTTENASTITASAGITSKGPRDPIPTNDNTTADIAVTDGTDVSLGKTRAPQGLILVGDEVTFTLQPRSAGKKPTQAAITDTLPANYQFVSVAADKGWSCSATGQTVDCDFTAATGSDYSSPITITAKAIAATPGAVGVTNVATISSPDENAGAGANNSGNDGAAFIAEPVVDLVAQKSGPDRGLVTVGNSYEFRLSARNDGNAGYSGELTITDHLPAGLTVTNIVTPAGWTCPAIPIVGARDVVCTTNTYTQASPLRPTEHTGVIVLTTEVTAKGTLTNGMTVSFQDYQDDDEQPGNNTTTSGVESADGPNWADVRVVKTLNPVPAKIVAGDPVTFKIEVVNAGPAVATNVVLDDRLNDIVAASGGEPGPGDVVVSFDEGLATGLSCQVPTSSGYSRDLQCIVPTLPVCVQGSNCPVVSVTVRPGSQGAKQNTAVAFSTEVPDNDTTNNSDSASYTVDRLTDVTVSKVSPASAAGAAAGQELVYVLTASVPRNGLSNAENVTLTDTLPNGLRFISAVPSAGVCSTAPAAGTITTGGAQLICNLGTISNGSQQTVTVRVVPTTPLTNTSIKNVVAVSTTTDEVDPDNNDADLTINILPPQLDLIVTKTDGPDPVLVGTDTRYTITVRNSGPSDATNVKIVDTLPDAAKLSTPRIVTPPSSGTCAIAAPSAGKPGGEVVCDIPHLAANGSISLAVDMRAAAKGVHTNTVSVTSDEDAYESLTDNNSSYENTTVRVLSDLQVTKVPSVSTVDLRKEFSWTITVKNSDAPGMDVAEWVTLVDELPVGMELTAPPTTTAGTCTGAIGQRTITCELGDINAGSSVTITLHTKITEKSAQSAQNSATAETLSFEDKPSDNTGTGSVTTVQGSSIGGTLYRDFDADDTKDAVDTGIAGITITVTGTAEHDGATITRTVTTDADGTYRFDDLPPGTYSVSYGNVSENHLNDGKALAGSGAGTATANGVNRIDGIVITNAVSGANHDFTLVPVARIGIGKVAGAVAVQTDGSYHIPYTLTVKNLSLEPLEDITVSDDFNDGVARNFGTFSGALVPPEGHYSIRSVSTNFGTVHSGFNGATNTSLVTAGTLPVGAIGTVSFTVHVNPVVPRVVPPLVHTNQAKVAGTGEHSRQPVTDLSHNNSNPDPDGNGIANEAGNDTPTAVTPVASPAVTLAKAATLTKPGAPAEGDLVTYNFTVTNTGKTPLVNVTVTDPMAGLVWVSNTAIGRLNPGESNNTAFVANYTLTQADIDGGTLPNTATVVGQWGIDGTTPVTVDHDASANVPLSEPDLTIVKEIEQSNVANPTVVGDTIRYKFTVTNTGNTTLRNVAVTDPLPGIAPDPANAFAIGALAPGASETVYADYAVTLADIDNGKVENTATASGVHGPSNTPITSDPDTASETLNRNPGLSLTKVLSGTIPSAPRAGDTLTWTVTAENTGNVTLTNLVVTDPFPNASVTPASHASLAPGATVDFTVTAPLTQAHIDAGEVKNTATVNFGIPNGPQQPPVQADEEKQLPHVPAIALTKVGDVSGLSSSPQPGEEIAYTIVIRNTGNVPLNNITLVDLLTGVVIDPTDATALAAVTLQPQNAAGNATGTEVTVNATYPLKREDIDAGSVVNTAVTTGTSTEDSSQTVTDRGGTTFETDDPTTTVLNRSAEIRLVKTITSAALSSPPKVGDVITYGFAVHNTGNVTLTGIALTELVADVFVQNTTGWTGPLAAGDVNTDAFTATYALKQADIDRGSFANTASVAGTGPGPGGTPVTVTDTSGTLTTNDTPVELPLTKASSLSIVKSHTAALSTPPKAGDEITYSFVVTNTGNVTLSDVVVADPMVAAGLVMPVTTIPTLLPGAENAVTLTGTYALKQSDIEAGEVRNIAEVEGVYKDPVTGTDTAVPPVSSNEIVVPLTRLPSIALVKSASSALSEPAVEGEVITYTFVVTNTGNLDLTDVEITDPLPGITPSNFAVGNLAPGASQSFTATYAIVAADIAAEKVENQATVTANYLDGSVKQPIDDLSGPTNETDEPVVVPVVPPAPALEIVKSGSFEDSDASGAPTAGDRVTFTFKVKNSGNIPLDQVIPVDAGPTFNGQPAGASLSAITPAPLTLAPGQEATFTATYPLTQGDIDNAAGIRNGVSNIASAKGYRDGVVISANLVESDPSDALIDLPAVPPADISLTKQVGLRYIRIGEKAPYTITATNNAVAKVSGLTITDVTPSGFRFVEGSATVDDVAVTPVVNGRNIVFENLTLSGGAKIVIRLQLTALSSAGPGKHVNTATATDKDGIKVAQDAKATIEILAEPVFDCGEVIGKVFDDKNRNGYQDKGEPGLPGVRVATVNGVLVTTDAEGRFHVACADMPDQRIGSNFIMKLDTRTLPSGYSVTTENPRVVRLTAGKMTKLNFGASIGRVIKLDLKDQAFIAGKTQLRPEWSKGLDKLVDLMAKERSVLRIRYLDASEGRELAGERMRALETELSRRWRAAGHRSSLEVETRVEASQ